MPDITCPVCGEVNSADQEFCQYCQSRLQPLTGPLKGADAPIQPGQVPVKKNTAELEPILPQWLRDARDKARRSAEEEAAQAARTPEPSADGQSPDLLAGLQSQQREDEEEIPDWLANITGKKPKSKKAAAEPTEVHWVELGGTEDYQEEGPSSVTATQEPSGKPDENLPSWMGGSEPSPEGGADELTDWLHRAQAEEPPVLDETGTGWPEASSATSAEKSMPAQPEKAAPRVKYNTDWFKNLDAQQRGSEQESAAKRIGTGPLTPAWLKDETPQSKPSEPEVPPWLQTSMPQAVVPAAAEQPAAPEGPDLGEDVPSWLKAAAPQASVFDEPPPEQGVAPASTLDWLGSEKPAQADATPAFVSDTPDRGGSMPAFMEGALSSQDADVLFTEMPDWLSSIGTGEPAAPASDGTQAITPGELPSWVQAMRPTESSPMEIAQIPTGDQTLETRGALAGLPGVLPAVPGMGPSSKPKAYSIKLQASEEQQAHAALLEQILAAETAPEPIASFAPLATSRLLRWALTAVLFGFISGVLMLRTQFFAVPTVPMDQPNEIGGALNAANAIPESAPVLVVIDYEPALAGEMEAAAAPLLDHAIILRHPSLTFISTSPTGALLAEHLISGPLKERGYQRGNQYVNLGYLPGGLTGVRAFAQNPPATVPLTVDFSPAWQTLPLQRVSSLAQFAAMVVITDNAESARTWIEQTTPWRGAVPVIMVASAQSAPMIRPYYDSHQVNGMVSGLYGGVIFEQSNAGLPGTARKYWDAFSLGMLLAMVLVLGGGFWNLALGLRDRVTAEGK